MLNLQSEKSKINAIIEGGLKEIIHKGLRVDGKTIGLLEDDISLLLKAMQYKNMIYDYAVRIDQGIGFYSGVIVYDLIKTDEDIYSGEVKFRF